MPEYCAEYRGQWQFFTVYLNNLFISSRSPHMDLLSRGGCVCIDRWICGYIQRYTDVYNMGYDQVSDSNSQLVSREQDGCTVVVSWLPTNTLANSFPFFILRLLFLFSFFDFQNPLNIDMGLKEENILSIPKEVNGKSLEFSSSW